MLIFGNIKDTLNRLVALTAYLFCLIVMSQVFGYIQVIVPDMTLNIFLLNLTLCTLTDQRARCTNGWYRGILRHHTRHLIHLIGNTVDWSGERRLLGDQHELKTLDGAKQRSAPRKASARSGNQQFQCWFHCKRKRLQANSKSLEFVYSLKSRFEERDFSH